MDKWFRSKWFVRILSLALAVMLYMFVNVEANTSQKDPRYTPSGSEEVETVDKMPVKIKMDENKYVVSGVPKTVSVSLEGSASVLRPTVRQRAFEVFVDLNGLGPGQHTVDLEVDQSQLPKGLKAYIEPKTVDVTIEKRSTKAFRVKVDFINEDQLPKGYELGEAVVEPGMVNITSSDSVIDQVALVKVFVDVKGLTDSINKREVPVNVYDHLGNELNVQIAPRNVVVSLDVHNPSKKVAVKVPTKGKLSDEYELKLIEPDVSEVEVFANKDTLKGIKEIRTEEIDLSKIKESGTIEASLQLPDNTKTDKNTVPVKIELNQKRTIENIQIDATGLERGLSVEFKKPDQAVIDLTVEGNEKEVSKLASGDFKATVDLSGLGEGEHQVPVKIKGPNQVDFNGKDIMATVIIS